MTIILHTPTPDLDKSLGFYQKLNWQIISKKEPTLVTDGKVIVEINPDRYARPGVKLFKASWKYEVEELKKLTRIWESGEGYLLNDFNGCWIYLVEGTLSSGNEIPGTSFGMTGNYSGLSLESAQMELSLEIWEKLGFSPTMGSPEKGFLQISNNTGFELSMMVPLTCPHLFFNPSMTFFNSGKNPEIIEKIRKTGIPITEEITHFNKEGKVDNIIIRDPGGYGFFVFND